MSAGILKSTSAVIRPTTKVIGNGAFTATGVVADGAAAYSSAQPSNGSDNDSTGDVLISGLLAQNLGMAEFSLLQMDSSARGAQLTAGIRVIGSRAAMAAIVALTVMHAVIAYYVLNREKNATSRNGYSGTSVRSVSKKTSTKLKVQSAEIN